MVVSPLRQSEKLQQDAEKALLCRHARAVHAFIVILMNKKITYLLHRTHKGSELPIPEQA